MISISEKGDFSKTFDFFEKVSKTTKIKELDKYGREGVRVLALATPELSGKTARSWDYEIIEKNNTVEIVFKNSNVINGTNIAIILQYGHGTRNGGYVQGKDYINKAIQPIFDKIAKSAWREVTKL